MACQNSIEERLSGTRFCEKVYVVFVFTDLTYFLYIYVHGNGLDCFQLTDSALHFPLTLLGRGVSPALRPAIKIRLFDHLEQSFLPLLLFILYSYQFPKMLLFYAF